MTELTWCSERLQTDVAPVGLFQFVEQRIRHASRELHWTFGRTRSVWYADERVSIKPRELREVEEYTGLRYGREELRDNDALIRQADALLMGTDPDFAGAFVAALRTFVGALDRSRTKGRVAPAPNAMGGGK